MATNPQTTGDSPSSPSMFLPNKRRSRRGSLASVSSTSQVDKEVLSQALDQIHTAASQFTGLTTFNQFTSPPSSSSGGEGKGIASDLQGGLSGLYNRFRASVGGIKDSGGSVAASEGNVDPTLSTKNNNTTTPVPTPIKKSTARGIRITDPSQSAIPTKDMVDKAESLIPLQSVVNHSTRNVAVDNIDEDFALVKDTLSVLNTTLKPLSWPGNGKLPLTSAQAGSSSVVGHNVAGVNISAPAVYKDQNEHGSLGHEDRMDPVTHAIPLGHRQDRSTEALGQSRMSTDASSKLQSNFSINRPVTNYVSSMAEVSRPVDPVHRDTLSGRSSDERTGAVPRRLARISEVNGGRQGLANSFQPDPDGAVSPKQIPAINFDGSDLASHPVLLAESSKDLMTTPTIVIERDRTASTSRDSQSSNTLRSPRPGQLHGLPGFNFSRTSSTDTAGNSSTNTALHNISSYEDGSGGEASKAGNDLSSKAAATTQTSGDSRGMNAVLSQIRSKVLSKEYWMRDENAKDCFFCGDSFSTFRRKHHCRTCGQIFDAKCTSLVSGKPFGQSGSLRVCKPCEGLINGYDDSSEFSDDGSVTSKVLRPRHGSRGASETTPVRSSLVHPRNPRESEVKPKPHGDTVPTMAIPATRRMFDDMNRRSAVLEIDAERRLTRPGSSRSLRNAALSLRPATSSHKRHNSRHLLQRSIRAMNEETAPFQRNADDESKQANRLPAFHSDNIIDPDLAAFLSDEESSDEEQLSIMSAMNGDGMGRSIEHDRNALSGFLASTRKSRSRIGDKSVSGVSHMIRDADDMISSRTPKRRNMSVSSNIHLRPSPRAHRFSTASPAMSSHLHESISSSALDQLSPVGSESRMIRSSSMKGSDAPAVELNNASIQHVRKLLRQLLQDSRIANIGSWERALTPILLQATDDVNPNVQNGDDIDIRHYVKLKRIPGGRPGDTSYVSGLVFTKNLALKSMPRSISQPNILILTFPLEYARHQQHFMSLEPVIRQEREYLQNLVHRIAALRPQLLLVQRNISGLALEFLEQANIATAYNVKPSVLEAIARCSQARIISSIDKLAIKSGQAGKCASFYLKTYIYNGRKKTYMYLTGCPKELGCTIVLRGGDMATLARIKRITEFMVYVVYNLKLETCLMRDEFALIPSYTGEGSISPDKETARKVANSTDTDDDRLMNTVDEASKHLEYLDGNGISDTAEMAIVDVPSSERTTWLRPKMTKVSETDDIQLPDDIPMPTFYGDMVEKHKTKILSASPFVKFMQPYLLMRAREQERRLLYLKRLCDQDLIEGQQELETVKPEKFMLIKPEMIHEAIPDTSKKFREVLHAVHDAEYDKALHNYRTQKKQWEAYLSGNINLFDPFAHQNIAVLYSVVCTVTTVPCSGPDLLALGFYNEHETDQDFEADCTLGQYVEDLCLGANTICTANSCERKMYEHHRQYVHGSAQLSVTVQHHSCELRGLQDSILMWSTCRICSKATQVMPMSDSTWKYSFGKYLELSFWSTELHPRAGVCPHDLHRDHLRYFGFKNIAVRVQYDAINILEIIVPRTRITWKVANDLRFKNDVFSKIEDRLNKFMQSVKARIKSIRIDSVIPEKTDSCKEEVDRLWKRASDDHHTLLRKLQEKYMGSKYFEIVPLNRAVRATQEKVAEWDNIFTEFDQNFFPSEKDIRRLATLQLKKIFLDRDDSVTSLTSTDEGIDTPSISEEGGVEKQSVDVAMITPQTCKAPPAGTQGVLNSLVEKHLVQADPVESEKATTESSLASLDPASDAQPITQANLQQIRHLDLAVPANIPDRDLEKARPPLPETQPVSPSTISESTRTSNDQSNLFIIEPVAERLIENQISTGSGPWTTTHISGIPRAIEISTRQTGNTSSPSLHRMQSQPTQIRREPSSNSSASLIGPSVPQITSLTRSSTGIGESSTVLVTDHAIKHPEKKLSDRFGLSTLKASSHSMIPRSIASRRKDSKVSTLAKHFEQLSREFEKERLRERRQRAAKSKQARAYPMAASKPIVEIYRNVHDAVEEREPSDEDSQSMETSPESSSFPQTHSQSIANAGDQRINVVPPTEGYNVEDTAGEETAAEDTAAEYTETDDNTHVGSNAESDVEDEGIKSDEEQTLLEDTLCVPELPESLLSANDTQLDLKIDLPKHEKTSLMKILTNFWAERSASGWQALEYPLGASDHIFADSDIIIREDEPSSLIAFALGSEDYRAKLQSIQEKSKDIKIVHNKTYVQDPLLSTEEQKRIECSLLQPTGTHLKYQFQEGSAKMLCKIFYAEQFDAVRRRCGVTDRIVDSLSRCLKWDSKGGKTKSVFLKTLDDRLVLKSLSQIETQAFLRFAPAYFELMSEALFHELPSVIAKMLGFYQVVIKNPVTGVEFNWFLLIMENLFYDRAPTRIFDLKGSMRNRRIQSTGEQNEVLLDENMVEFIYESPLFVREHAKKLLRASVWNDTLFLSRQNVMDYSLMIAIDENRKELVVGIIDCIRTYTWDKKLESWMKDRGKNRPTVTSPKEYKSRFREAMGRYVLHAPNCWHQFLAQQLDLRSVRYQGRLTDNGEDPAETELAVTDD